MKTNLDSFKKDIDDYKKEIFNDLGKKDLQSLKRLQWLKKIVLAISYSTSWIIINPLSMFLFAFCDVLRWGDMHHVGHCGYDKVDGVPEHFKGKKYAKGWRRFIDWPEWMHPDDWNYEHNILHHYNTNQTSDPDLVIERAKQFSRSPIAVRYLMFGIFTLTWKWLYYSPGTYSAAATKGKDFQWLLPFHILNFRRPEVRELWTRNYIPIFLFKFILIPSLFIPISFEAAQVVFFNAIGGELLSNFWTFFVIVSNHAGDDLLRFSDAHRSKGEWYYRQIRSSTDYKSYNRYTDIMMFWLNFQTAHHIFPNLPHERYREITPRLKEICKKHHVQFNEGSVLERFFKLVNIYVGNTTMEKLSSQDMTGVGPKIIKNTTENEAEDFGCHSVVQDAIKKENTTF